MTEGELHTIGALRDLAFAMHAVARAGMRLTTLDVAARSVDAARISAELCVGAGAPDGCLRRVESVTRTLVSLLRSVHTDLLFRDRYDDADHALRLAEGMTELANRLRDAEGK